MTKAGALVPELFRNLNRRPVTRFYPFEKAEVPERFRGTPRFRSDNCIGCKVCMRDCPSDAIHIEVQTIPSTEPQIEGQPAPKPKKKITMILYLDRCVHCERCAEVCPKDAIFLDTEFELANFSRDALRLVQE
jgi:formate hydrogenlyase subunit 6/NADH:ubiquinone oxidoreductase subunit I